MKILHIIISLDPQLGGPPMIAARLAAAQARLGHEVTIFSTEDGARREVIATALHGIPDFDRVKRVILPPPSRWESIFGSQARVALEPLVKQADAVHIHSIWESVLRVGATLARRHRKPYFILLNGMLDPWSLAQRRTKKKIAMMLAYRRMFNGAAAFHAGNSDEVRLIQPLGLRPPAVIIPNGVFLEEIADLPPLGTFYAKHPELDGKPFILFLSRIHYKKGLDYLAAAFAIVAKKDSRVRLVVAGPDGGERENFEKWIRVSGVEKRVHLVGPLYGRDKLAAYVDATCFCLPSRQEGFSVAITEALGCGVPAVVSEGCHFPEVQDSGAGFVTPLDATEVAEALVRILGDEKLRQKMTASGKALVESKLTWPVIAEQAVTMYRKAIDAAK